MKKMPIPCSIYRSSKRDELFLYVKHNQKLSELPQELLSTLGDLEHSLNILLTEDKKLARFDAKDVIKSIQLQGYFLQLPPAPDEQVEALIRKEQEKK